MGKRIMLVDDHKGFRANLRSLLGSLPGQFDIVGEAGDATEAMRKLDVLLPDVAVVDIGLPDECGLRLARTIRDRFPATNVVVLSQYDVQEYQTAAMAIEGCTFVPKAELVYGLPRALATFAEPGRVEADLVGVGQAWRGNNVATATRVSASTPRGAFEGLQTTWSGADRWLEARSQARNNRRLWTAVHVLVSILCLQIIGMQVTDAAATTEGLVASLLAGTVVLATAIVDLASLLGKGPGVLYDAQAETGKGVVAG